MTDKPLSVRIPAMIAKAEKHIASSGHRANSIVRGGASCPWRITDGEVTLAKALHEASESLNAEFGREFWPDALVEFTEKMESHD